MQALLDAAVQANDAPHVPPMPPPVAPPQQAQQPLREHKGDDVPQQVSLVFSVSKGHLDDAELKPPRIRPRSHGKRPCSTDGPMAYLHSLRGAFTFAVYGGEADSDETMSDEALAHTTQMPLFKCHSKAARALRTVQTWNRVDETWRVRLHFETAVPGPYRVRVSHPRIHSFWVDTAAQ
jgi:hypothetical protein